MAKQKAFVLSIKGLILALLGLADRCTPIISWAAAAAHCQQLPLNRAHLRLRRLRGAPATVLVTLQCRPWGISHSVAAFMTCTSCATNRERETWSAQDLDRSWQENLGHPLPSFKSEPSVGRVRVCCQISSGG